MKDGHEFYTTHKIYDRYKIHMTQHIFIGTGIKRYGPIHWVVFLDKEHIVLNTYIRDRKTKIDESFMDEHWNLFVTKYNYNIDVWSTVQKGEIEVFNEYRKALLPDKSGITLTDFDEAMGKIKAAENKSKNMARKVKKIGKRIELFEQDMIEKLKVLVCEINNIK